MSIFKSDPAAPGANVGRRRTRRAESPGNWLGRAVVRFNASEVAHTVTGLTRSLGEPRISIGAAAGSRSEVRITVAWELCWYQWGVDLGDEQRPVFPIGKGNEIEQLDPSARQWNARASRSGQLVLGASVGGRARDGEPVG